MSPHETMPVLPEPLSGMGRGAWLIAATAAALALAGVLGAFQLAADRLHDPRIDYLSHRVEILRAGERPADVLFLGTSVVYRNIDTGNLNRLARAAGCDLTFYNLGLPAMTVADFRLLLGRLGRGGERPRVVAFNPTLYDGLTLIETRRASWSNRIGALPLAWASLGAARTTARLASRPEQNGDGLGPRLAFARHWLLSSLRTGEAAHWILRDRPGPVYQAIRQRHRENAGFLALEEDPNVGPERRAAFLDDLEGWRERSRAVRSAAAEYYRETAPGGLPEDERRLQERLIALVRATGAEPMAVFPPQAAYQSRLIELYRDLLGDAGVIDLTFGELPEFLDEGLWYDRTHLNRDGSRRLSERLLPRFCAAS